MDAGLKTYRNIAEQKQRDELILAHLRYVKHLLGKILIEFPDGVDIENLEAAGVLGLVEAANRFSEEHGVDFKTFAYQRIRGAIFDELRRNCPLPQHVLQQWSLIREVIQSFPGPISTHQIAMQTGLKLEEIERCLVAIRMTNLEAWNEDLTPLTTRQEQSDEEFAAKERQRTLVLAIEALPARLRSILTLYYQDDLTLKEIGEVLGLSESRVSRLLAQAELTLKTQFQRHN